MYYIIASPPRFVDLAISFSLSPVLLIILLPSLFDLHAIMLLLVHIFSIMWRVYRPQQSAVHISHVRIYHDEQPVLCPLRLPLRRNGAKFGPRGSAAAQDVPRPRPLLSVGSRVHPGARGVKQRAVQPYMGPRAGGASRVAQWAKALLVSQFCPALHYQRLDVGQACDVADERNRLEHAADEHAVPPGNLVLELLLCLSAKSAWVLRIAPCSRGSGAGRATRGRCTRPDPPAGSFASPVWCTP